MTKNIKSYASKYKGRNPAVVHIQAQDYINSSLNGIKMELTTEGMLYIWLCAVINQDLQFELIPMINNHHPWSIVVSDELKHENLL